MASDLHFISGLPRSGSTLLAALLRQNPRLHTGISSPVGYLIAALLRTMSQEQATSVLIDAETRGRVVTACVQGYYAHHLAAQTVFDTNRGWCGRMSLLADLWPGASVIALVRNPAWILDSLERLTQRNALEPSGIFGFTTEGTVYSRAEGLMSGSGLIGFAMNALREAVFGAHRARLLLVRYETLAADPLKVLAAVYDRIGGERADHDPECIEPDYEAMMFDARLGVQGLHALAPQVRRVERRTVLPPDLFNQFENAFWDSGELPDDVQIV